MRLGRTIGSHFTDPEMWVAKVRSTGSTCADCPIRPGADDATIKAFRDAAQRADVLIAEVGVWNNPLDRDEARARQAIETCISGLRLAEEIGARCAVNIAGSLNPTQWDGPDPGNFSPATFDRIVQTVRQIIDAVKPRRAAYTLEPMPWVFPDSPDSYLDLIRAVDRDRFAVHLDVVNMMSSPRRLFDNAAFIRECFAKLGPRIAVVHAKDAHIATKLTVQIEERRPGMGCIDYGVMLRELSRLPADTPVLVEHLPSDEEYALGMEHLRAVAQREGIELR